MNPRQVSSVSWQVLLLCLLIPVLGIAGAMLATNTDYIFESRRFLPTAEFPVVTALPAIALWFGIGIAVVALRKQPTNRVGIFLAAFGLRLLVGFLLAYLFQYDDERGQHDWAQIDVLLWQSGRAGRYVAGSGGYQQILTVLYYVFGVNLLIAKSLNALLGALLPFLLYDLAKVIFPEQPSIADRALYYGAFLPPLVIYGSVNLKELPTAFVITLVFWLLLVPNWQKLWRIAAGTVGLALTFYLRRGWFFFPLAGMLTYVLLGDRWQPKKLLTARRLVPAVLAVVTVLIVLSPLIEQGQEYAQWLQDRPEAESKFQTVAGGATVGQFLDTRNRFSPRNMIVLVSRAIFTPSPFRVLFDHGIDVVLEGAVMLTWYVLLPLAIIGVLSYWRRGGVVAWAITAIAIFILAALGTSFAGDIYRHRIVMFPLLYLLAAAGQEGARRYRWIVWGWVGLAFMFTLVYSQLRN